MHIMSRQCRAAVLLAASLGLLLGGCSSSNISLTKRIDYKSASSTSSLELPPDLTTPRYDDRYQVNSASGLAAQNANKSGRGDLLPTVPDAKIVRAGSERWLVVLWTTLSGVAVGLILVVLAHVLRHVKASASLAARAELERSA
jgi:uncharacterized lipoprotein